MEHHVHGMHHLGVGWMLHLAVRWLEVLGLAPVQSARTSTVVPDPAMGAKPTIETLSAGLYTTKAAVQNMHNWIGSIAEAVSGHADQLRRHLHVIEGASGNVTEQLASLRPELTGGKAL